MATSDPAPHQGQHNLTPHFTTFRDAAVGSDQAVQGTDPLSQVRRHGSHSFSHVLQSCQLFMSVAVNQPGIDYHVVLAQNALQQALDMVELQSELICTLVKQTSRHTGQKLGVGVQVNKKLGIPARVSCWQTKARGTRVP